MVEPTGSETQVFAKLGGEQVVAVFRERHQFNPGDKVRLKPDPSLIHLFDEDDWQASYKIANRRLVDKRIYKTVNREKTDDD